MTLLNVAPFSLAKLSANERIKLLRVALLALYVMIGSEFACLEAQLEMLTMRPLYVGRCGISAVVSETGA